MLNTLENTIKRPNRKRVGKGDGSVGKTCGRGTKGYGSRTGSHSKSYFEGGQMPLMRRLPKRGFKCYNRKEYTVINLDTLNENFEASEEAITKELLLEKGLISKKELDGLKVLGNGDISISISIVADKFSNVAKTKIEAAGGKCLLRTETDKKE